MNTDERELGWAAEAFHFEAGLAEVEEQAKRFAGGLEVVQALGHENAVVVVGRLEFQQKHLLDEDVNAEFPYQDAVVVDLDRPLLLAANRVLAQLVNEGVLVHLLQEPAAERAGHLERAADHLLGEPIEPLL